VRRSHAREKYFVVLAILHRVHGMVFDLRLLSSGSAAWTLVFWHRLAQPLQQSGVLKSSSRLTQLAVSGSCKASRRYGRTDRDRQVSDGKQIEPIACLLSFWESEGMLGLRTNQGNIIFWDSRIGSAVLLQWNLESMFHFHSAACIHAYICLSHDHK